MTDTTPLALRLPISVHRSRRWRLLPIMEIVVLAIGALLPLVLQDYLTVYATRVLILCLFALSFDLVWGYAGIMSFGQAAFFGSAGYGVALIARDLGVTSILVVLPAGLLIGFTFAFLLGGFLLLGRRPSSVIFVSLGTLTGSYAFDRLARGWYYLGGQNGIPSIPPMSLGNYDLDEGPAFYYLAMCILLLVYLLCRFLVVSQFGLALAGLRDSEQRITFFGYRVQHLKAIIFSFAGAIAGLAGSLYAFHEGFVWPNMLGVVMSTLCLVWRRRDADRGGDRHRGHRSGQLLAVEQLPGHLADHSWRAAAAGYSISSSRAYKPDRQRARTRRPFRSPERETSWLFLKRAGSPRLSAN